MRTLTIATLTLLMTILLASRSVLAASKFEMQVRSAQKSCPTLACSKSTLQLRKLTGDELRRLSPATLKSLKEVGNYVSRTLWPDTILEGPFYVQFQIRVEKVERVIEKGSAIGWRVTYSDQAWNIDTCNFDERNMKTLEKCEAGRIFESAFADNNFSSVFRDDNAYATYSSAVRFSR